MWISSRAVRAAAALLAVLLLGGVRPAPSAGSQAASGSRAAPHTPAAETADTLRPDFARLQREQADTDRVWRQASEGYMRMEKITYRSPRRDLQIPAFVFQPLNPKGLGRHPALVWVHENIRGHLYEHYIPYIREATGRGYVVIAPEYRGSIGYGRAFYDAIDYGGAEVDDVAGAVAVLRSQFGIVAPDRIGIIGWSHGGLITLLATFRNPTLFHAAAAMVPVTNLFHRLARKGVEPQRRLIDPQNRFGGSPSERPDVYRYRSPLFHVDELTIPLLVHVAENDEDVTYDEAVQLVDALHARKPDLADVKVYPNPAGAHLFDRRVSPSTHLPENAPEQLDSWTRVWSFFDTHLEVPTPAH